MDREELTIEALCENMLDKMDMDTVTALLIHGDTDRISRIISLMADAVLETIRNDPELEDLPKEDMWGEYTTLMFEVAVGTLLALRDLHKH